jgi:hypothetical protein
MTAALAPIGLALSFVSTAYQGIAGAQAANYQAAIAEQNQQVANVNADRTIQASQVEQQDRDLTARALLGEQVSEQAASGLTLGSKSFRLARRSSQQLARQDALRIRQSGEVDAYNYRTQASNFGMQAQLAKSSASASLLGGFLGAGTSLISGASKIYVPKATV